MVNGLNMKRMETLFWSLAEHNAYIGMQCKEYRQRHESIWGRRWWFLMKCILRNCLQDKLIGKSIHSEDIVPILTQYDVISFDMFDTLLIRPYDKPTDLFTELEKRYMLPGFAKQRIDAERRAREIYCNQEDVSFKQIYEVIKDEYKIMAQKEIALEQEVLKVNRKIKKLYDAALALEKRIIIVSDMYLPGKVLDNILKDKGYGEYEKIYVSSETGYTKASGNMYQYVLNHAGCREEQILHIGDNLWSDGNARRKNRLSTILISREEMVYLT